MKTSWKESDGSFHEFSMVVEDQHPPRSSTKRIRTSTQIVQAEENMMSGVGHKKIAHCRKHGKMIAEEYIPISKKVTQDYHSGKVTTEEKYIKKKATMDYKRGTMALEDSTTTTTVTNDKKKGVTKTVRHESSTTAITGSKAHGKVVTKESRRKSKEMTRAKTSKGKWQYMI